MSVVGQPSIRYHDTATIFCDSGVATEEQVGDSLKEAIKQAEEILGYETNCRYKVNLIVDKDGKYFGFGYIRVSKPEIYWMLLGRNPDGTERIEEYPDPDWVPPSPKQNTENENKSWVERIEEEEAYIQPKIKKNLHPLITVPGYSYDQDQMEHLRDLEKEKGEAADIKNIPSIGYFEISRAYATDPPAGMIRNRICARNVPDWVPIEAFKGIFSPYVSEENRGKKGTIYVGNKEITDTYPIVNFVESNSNNNNNKKSGKIVFVTFDAHSKDAIFCLLMTKKTRIVNPKNKNQKTTLVFMHAYDNQK